MIARCQLNIYHLAVLVNMLMQCRCKQYETRFCFFYVMKDLAK